MSNQLAENNAGENYARKKALGILLRQIIFIKFGDDLQIVLSRLPLDKFCPPSCILRNSSTEMS